MFLGIEFASGVFQWKIENILRMYDFLGVFLDDVIISDAIEQEHFGREVCVLKCFSEYDINFSNNIYNSSWLVLRKTILAFFNHHKNCISLILKN